MRSFSNTEIRRCRPCLGTFVEIGAEGAAAAKLQRAIEDAFAAVTRVHRLMSFHDPRSDLSRMNREAFFRSVTVDPWTWQVLRTAQNFSRESNGVFDTSIAPLLTELNHVIRRGYRFDPTGTWRDISLRKKHRVRFRRRIAVDLGGIAKGFAVDRAVEALLNAGISSGIVNAGGDLRVFGFTLRSVRVRHPVFPGTAAGLFRVRNYAVATSALYFTPNRDAGRLIDGRTRRAIRDSVSVTVWAPECMTADALTKIVFALRGKAAPLLKRHRAGAILLERNGRPRSVFQSPCDPTR
jgi:FAD:protein FMN transferase